MLGDVAHDGFAPRRLHRRQSSLLKALKTIPFYKWMFDKLPEQDREDA